MDEELKKLKNEIINQPFTEDYHHSLKEINSNSAKQIVESMNDIEVYRKVNLRQTQEDYIADYIHFLWDISKKSYWKHILILIDEKKGMLWSDHMDHYYKMSNYKLPKRILFKLITFFYNSQFGEGKFYESDVEIIGCILKAQVEKFDRLKKISSHIDNSKFEAKEELKDAIESLIQNKCPYQFYEL